MSVSTGIWKTRPPASRGRIAEVRVLRITAPFADEAAALAACWHSYFEWCDPAWPRGVYIVPNPKAQSSRESLSEVDARRGSERATQARHAEGSQPATEPGWCLSCKVPWATKVSRHLDHELASCEEGTATQGIHARKSTPLPRMIAVPPANPSSLPKLTVAVVGSRDAELRLRKIARRGWRDCVGRSGPECRRFARSRRRAAGLKMDRVMRTTRLHAAAWRCAGREGTADGCITRARGAHEEHPTSPERIIRHTNTGARAAQSSPLHRIPIPYSPHPPFITPRGHSTHTTHPASPIVHREPPTIAGISLHSMHLLHVAAP